MHDIVMVVEALTILGARATLEDQNISAGWVFAMDSKVCSLRSFLTPSCSLDVVAPPSVVHNFLPMAVLPRGDPRVL